METYPQFSYPESGDSSPRSREIDFENPTPTWEEPPTPQPQTQPATQKVKFMVSYGGKIQPRSHDNLLAYVGGETKILALDRTVKFIQVRSKLATLLSLNLNDVFTLKYQLPGEDLDALISVTNDDDLEHMMHEFDRLCKASSKPARLRLFLFIDHLHLQQRNNSGSSCFSSISSDRVGLDREPVLGSLISSKQSDVVSDPPSTAMTAAAAAVPAAVPQLLPVHNNVDYLFGLDKVSTVQVSGPVQVPGPVQVEPVRTQISAQELQLQKLQQQQQQQQQSMIFSTKNDESYGDAYRDAPSPVNIPANYQIPQGYWQPNEHQNQNHQPQQQLQQQQQQHQFHQQQQQPQQAVYMMHAPPSQGSMYHAPPAQGSMYHAPALQPPNQGYYQVQQMPVMMTAESAGYAPVNQVYYTAAAAAQGGGVTAAYSGMAAATQGGGMTAAYSGMTAATTAAQGGGVTAAYGGVTAVTTAAVAAVVVGEEVKVVQKVGASSGGV
ncbi:hypothetical protein vseg_007087 [Gypsophila vaccaria]